MDSIYQTQMVTPACAHTSASEAEIAGAFIGTNFTAPLDAYKSVSTDDNPCTSQGAHTSAFPGENVSASLCENVSASQSATATEFIATLMSITQSHLLNEKS